MILSFVLTDHRYPLPLLDRYYTKGFSPVYIATFVLWCMFVLSKVLLAVVNSSFAEVQHNKFKSLYLHRRSVTIQSMYCFNGSMVFKRNALRHAFELLETNGVIMPALNNYFTVLYCEAKQLRKLLKCY